MSDKSSKIRLDILLASSGMAPSREKARRMIMAGEVFVDGIMEDKPGMKVPAGCSVEIHSRSLKYVSRGGFKLEKAVDVFGISLSGLVCLDIGASTGGFTDCMLQNGASRVYSVDVGYGQLDYRLRNDPRVVCMERTNFRYLGPGDFPERADFASCDVSFISLSKMLPPAAGILKDGARAVALIKPQFEAGREKVGKKGVVRDPEVHSEVISRVFGYAVDAGLSVAGLSYSPITGPEGNIEYLCLLSKGGEDKSADINISRLVGEAHEAFSDNSK